MGQVAMGRILTFIRRYIWLILGLLLLFWALRGVDLQATWEVLSSLRLWQILVLIVVNIGVLITLYMRWSVILRGMGYQIPLSQIARYTLAGFAVSYLTPGPQFGGEPLQILFLTRQHQVPLQEATASVAIEKLLGLVTDLFFLSIGLLFVLQTELLPAQNEGLASGLLAVSIGLFLFLFWGWYRGRLALTNLLRWVSRVRPSLFQALLIGLADTETEIVRLCQEKTRFLALSIFFSVISWLLFAFEYLLTALFLGVTLTPLLGILLISAFRLAFLVPVPGGFGTITVSQVAVLRGLGVPNAVEIGLGLSLIIHLRDLIITAIGLFYAGQLPVKDKRQETRD